jgi:hypothetical protein
MSPWRAYLLMLQGHTRWTGTHEEMISSDLHGAKSHEMDVETLAGGRDRSEDCTRERGGRFTRGNLTGLDPGWLCPLHHDVGLGRPMMSSSALGGFGGSCVPSGTCGRLLRPKKA